MMDHDRWLRVAIDEAEQGLAEGGVPIGSALVCGGQLLGAGHNRRHQSGSVIRHAEMDALERAGRHPAEVYSRSTLYTTLSPCEMCTGAALLYRIPRVVIGENQTFMGAEHRLREAGVEVIVLDDERCKALMATFIQQQPALWAEDIGEPAAISR